MRDADRTDGLCRAPFLMVIAKVFAVGYDKGISHLGLWPFHEMKCSVFARMADYTSATSRSVGTTGQELLVTWSHMTQPTSCTSIGAQSHSTSVKIWSDFQKLSSGSGNTERTADIVEASLKQH